MSQEQARRHEGTKAQSEERITVAYDRYAQFAGSDPDGNAVWRSFYGIPFVERYPVRSRVWFTWYFFKPIIMSDVEFASEFGYRAGCVPSGVLGFATGRLLSADPSCLDASVPSCLRSSGLWSPITFDGRQFLIKETRQPITRCEQLLLMPDGRASALLCEADLRTFVEQQFGRTASMPLADLRGFDRMPPDCHYPIGHPTPIEIEDETTPR